MPQPRNSLLHGGTPITRPTLIRRAMQEDRAAIMATTRPAALSHSRLATLMRAAAETTSLDGVDP